ncbi:hypothetical protein ACETK8_18635 [Brevundimonas staleyi]|uniref:DUF2939 domain-containing protein n=1 Tax=Brevundimonas staleyi TaxID=74326 RepID=A0ABW0FQX9_9CAUL
MPHYARILSALILVAFAAGGAIWRWWKPKPEPLYEERVMLDEALRARLQALRDEDKFHAGEGYAGPKGPKNRATLSGWVNGVIDDILAEDDGPLEASDVAGRIGLAIGAASKRPHADQERLHGYLIEIWWILGYRSATGYFPTDDAPEGWGERLPPGWASPERPRSLTGR